MHNERQNKKLSKHYNLFEIYVKHKERCYPYPFTPSISRSSDYSLETINASCCSSFHSSKYSHAKSQIYFVKYFYDERCYLWFPCALFHVKTGNYSYVRNDKYRWELVVFSSNVAIEKQLKSFNCAWFVCGCVCVSIFLVIVSRSIVKRKSYE